MTGWPKHQEVGATVRPDNSRGRIPIRFDDRPISSVRDLVGLLLQDAGLLRGGFDAAMPPVWYRGQQDKELGLLPSLARDSSRLLRERALLNRFKQNAHQFLSRDPEDEWEWLFLARHHGVESRLLDWSESPLIGLYFAVSEFSGPAGNAASSAMSETSDGALWCLLPTVLNDGRFGGDPLDIPMFEDVDAGLGAYLPQSVETSIRSGRKVKTAPAAGLAKRRSLRIQSQQGVFTIVHADPIPVEDAVVGQEHVWRYVIPAQAKEAVRRELAILGLTPLSIFPELDNVALNARNTING